MEGIVTGTSWPKGTWELSIVFLLFIVSLRDGDTFLKDIPFALKKKFIYFWLHWVFFGLPELSLVAKKS